MMEPWKEICTIINKEKYIKFAQSELTFSVQGVFHSLCSQQTNKQHKKHLMNPLTGLTD